MRTEQELRNLLNKLEHKIKQSEYEGRYSDAMVMRYMMDILIWILED